LKLAQDFLQGVADDLRRLLPLRGFQGRDLKYRKQDGHVVSCLAVQEHSSEERCCVDLGVHLDFLPAVGGSDAVPLEVMGVTLCEIRRRLAPRPDLEDFWWAYGQAGAREGLTAALEAHGLPFFARFEAFPDYWLNISREDLRGGTFAIRLPGMTRVRAALLLARVHAFLGNGAKCREFAAYGLEITPAVATGPKRAFRELLAQQLAT
jgi:Domain of unknown function (DUF4304)